LVRLIYIFPRVGLELTELNSILGNSVEKYQYLINNIADVIAEIDLNGILTYISPQVHKMFGYKPEEIIGAKFFNYIHPEDMPSIIDAFEKAINSEDSISIEYRVRHKEGYFVNVLENGSLVKVENNLKIVGVLKDITEKKLSERKLKESEETFKKIINQSFMGTVIIQDLSIKYVNETVTKMLGYSVDEMANWSINDLLNTIHVNDRTIAKERLERRQEGLYTETPYTYKVFTKAGDLRWIDIYAKQIYYQGKESIFATLMDVTKREKGVLKVKESEEKYRELFNNISSGVAVYEAINDGEDFIFKDINLAGEKIENVRREDLIDKKVTEIFPGVKEFGLFDIFQKVWRTGNSEHLPIKLYKDNRIAGWRENYVYKLPSGEIIAVYNDVTESKKARQKLLESEKKFKMLYENAPLPYQSLDANGNILDVNRTWLDFFGYTKEEVIGRWLGDFMDPSCRDFLEVRFRQFKEEGEVQEVQYEVITKDGSHKIILFDGRVGYNESGGFERTHCIFKDMTARIKFERKIKESEQKLREINQLKSELLIRTSHELKTPLISIKGFTDLLLDLYKEKFDTETISILDEVKQGTEQLEMIINKLLESSQLASGKLDFKPTQDDLSFLIKFCVKNLRGLANTRNHFISLDIPEKQILNFEKEKLYEVISHLIINAIKYTPPFGDIKIQSEINDDYIIVSVKDNGIGLTEEEQKKIFKQFGKIERYGQGWDIGIEGTGMGLYTSKKIVELHGGKIWVESEGRNMGSKFFFSLPFSNE